MIDKLNDIELTIELKNHLSKFNTFSEFWNNCDRGDFLLQVAHRLKVKKVLIYKVALHSVLTAYDLHDDNTKILLGAIKQYSNRKIQKSKMKQLFSYWLKTPIENEIRAQKQAIIELSEIDSNYDDLHFSLRYTSVFVGLKSGSVEKRNNEKRIIQICHQFLTNEVIKIVYEKDKSSILESIKNLSSDMIHTQKILNQLKSLHICNSAKFKIDDCLKNRMNKQILVVTKIDCDKNGQIFYIGNDLKSNEKREIIENDSIKI